MHFLSYQIFVKLSYYHYQHHGFQSSNHLQTIRNLLLLLLLSFSKAMTFAQYMHPISKSSYLILFLFLLLHLIQLSKSYTISTFYKQGCIPDVDCEFESQPIQIQVTPISSTTISDSKLTGEICQTSSECRENRRCMQDSGLENQLAIPCESTTQISTDICFCMPENLEQCKVDADCKDEEICDSELTNKLTFCRSPALDQQKGVGTKLTGQICHDDFDCRTPRLCFSQNLAELCRPLGQNVTKEDEDNSSCVCRPLRLTRCEVTRDCSKGEYCGNVDGEDNGLRVCLADDVKALPNELRTEGGINGTVGVKSDGVCVDSKLLNGLNHKELVFKEDVLAEVLCDIFGSCSTPGHMVVWKGKSMMMKRYCRSDGVKCRKEVIYVNSRKWGIGRRIKSNTVGLEFTTLAARYESWVEESVLRCAIGSGA